MSTYTYLPMKCSPQHSQQNVVIYEKCFTNHKFCTLGTYIKIRIHLFLSKYFAHFKIELLFFAETYNKMIILRLKKRLDYYYYLVFPWNSLATEFDKGS